MTDEEELVVSDHERRIVKLELSTAEIHAKVDNINTNVLDSQSRADEQGKYMVAQNNDLIRQNAALGQQLKDVFDSVLDTRDKESNRRHDLRKTRSENTLKLVTLVLGSGSIGILLADALINFMN